MGRYASLERTRSDQIMYGLHHAVPESAPQTPKIEDLSS